VDNVTDVNSAKVHVKYCDYPGERIVEHVRFEVNGTKLDEYDTHAYVLYRNVELGEQDTYKRCMGHSTPWKGVERLGKTNV